MIRWIAILMVMLMTNICEAHIFIGDSRFVGMEMATEYDATWISEGGVGNVFYWEQRDYISTLDREEPVVYALGVNDREAEDCVEVLNDMVSLGFKRIYFLTVTPVDESVGMYDVTNAEICEYNDYVLSNIHDVQVIDGYDYLMSNGFEADDGLHYDFETYERLLQYIIKVIG